MSVEQQAEGEQPKPNLRQRFDRFWSHRTPARLVGINPLVTKSEDQVTHGEAMMVGTFRRHILDWWNRPSKPAKIIEPNSLSDERSTYLATLELIEENRRRDSFIP